MILIVAFVFLLSSMPPLTVVPQAGPWVGYKISVNTTQWRLNANTYMAHLRQGTLGIDRKRRPIAPRLATRFENSLLLLGLAAFCAVVFGVMKGFWDYRSLRRGKNGIGPALTGAVQGIPDFWLVIMIQLLAIWLYKTYGWRPFRITYNEEEQVRSLIVPVFALSLIPAATIARITSNALIDIWERDYIRTARAKGLHESNVLFKHAFRNAAVQVLDALPNVSAIMLANLLIVEYMTAYPGLTTMLYEAMPNSIMMSPGQVASADTPVLAAAGICLAVTFSLLHFVVNLARRLADPRLRERGAA